MKRVQPTAKKAIIASSIALLMAAPSAAYAAQEAALSSGSVKTAAETARAPLADSAQVPIRQVAESLGAKVEWDPAARAVTILRGADTIILTVGKKQASVNGKEVQMSEAVSIADQKTYASLDFLNESLGTAAYWSAADEAVTVDAGDFKGAASLFVHHLFAGAASKLPSMMSAPLQQSLPEPTLGVLSQQYAAAYGRPAMQLTAAVQTNDVHTSVVMGYETDKGPLEITVRFKADGLIDDLYFAPLTPAAPYQKPEYDKGNYTEKEVVIGEGDYALPGTLTLPEGEGPFAAVILVHGSGPHDRDSSIGGAKVFKDIAAGLAARNIATLRYEKVSKEHTFKLSAQPKFTLKNETADDALLAAGLLAAMKEIDSARIYVAGHSQGGYAVPIMLDSDTNSLIDGAILLSAPSGQLTDVMVEQQDEALKRMNELGLPEEMIAAQERSAAMIKQTAALIQNPEYSAEKLPEPFPLPPAYWWYEQRDYVPSESAKSQTAPLLILQGENDWQVSMKQYEGWKTALAARPNTAFKSYPKLNHLMTEYEGLSIGMEYGAPANVSAEVITDMADWIDRQK